MQEKETNILTKIAALYKFSSPEKLFWLSIQTNKMIEARRILWVLLLEFGIDIKDIASQFQVTERAIKQGQKRIFELFDVDENVRNILETTRKNRANFLNLYHTYLTY